MIFTSNKPMREWARVVHDPDLAEAILDRVLERGMEIHFKGPSYRTRHLHSKDGFASSGRVGPVFQDFTIARSLTHCCGQVIPVASTAHDAPLCIEAVDR